MGSALSRIGRASRPIEIRKVSGAIGAEMHGIDLSRPLDQATVAAIRRVWLEHCAVFFRDQHLTPAQVTRLAGYFGTPAVYPMFAKLEGFPGITPVVKLEHERENFGGLWHSDTSYLDEPPMGTILLALVVPPCGGDTLFANQYLAYEALSNGLKRTLDGLTAVYTCPDAHYNDTAVHPVVRTHPETGRKALFANFGHTTRFENWTEQESAPLLSYLFRHQVRPEYTCRFSWRPGSIAFWDNRAAQHNAVNDYHGHRRVMQRITLAGDRPR